MKISIVVCTYNGMSYLEEQLDSLRLQTRKPDEVLVSDDNSDDGTVEYVKSYINKYNLDNWLIRVNKPNLGWRKNFMKAIHDSIGDMVFTCYQDDIWDENKIKYMSEIMVNHNEINLLTSNFYEWYSDNSLKEIKYSESEEMLIQVSLPINLLNCPFPGCVQCIRKSFYNKYIQYWLDTCPHDAFFWRTAILDESAYICNQSLIKWRKHENSAFQTELSSLTKKSELFWREQERKELVQLIEFVDKENLQNKKFKIDSLQYNLNWVNDRETACKKPSVANLGKLIFKYRDLYPKTKSVIKDWYIFLFKR